MAKQTRPSTPEAAVDEPKVEEGKEEPVEVPRAAEAAAAAGGQTTSPTDTVLKLKNGQGQPRRSCSRERVESEQAPEATQPPPPPVALPPAPGPNGHWQAGPPPGYPGPQWHHPEMYGYDQHNPHVRLPSIATLLTEPYSPQPPHMGHPQGPPPPHPQGPHMIHPAHMPRYPDHRPDWPQQPMAQMPYPPTVASIPLEEAPRTNAGGPVRSTSPASGPQRKRGRLPKETTDFLKAWLHSHSAHPYPSEIEKKQMCLATGLSMSQVSNWMINGRRRILGPSYLSTSRSSSHVSNPVTLSAPNPPPNTSPVLLSHPPGPGPIMMLRSPTQPT